MPTRSRLRPEQRQRLRRLLRWGLGVVIGAEVLLVALAATPASAVIIVCSIPCPVYDAQLDRTMWDVWRRVFTDINTQRLSMGMLPHLEQIERDQTHNRERAEQHSRELNNDWDADLADVTATPTSRLTGISFAEADPGGALMRVVPRVEAWDSYYDDYLTSADTALSTLRSSLDALHEHNLQIEDDTALRRIAQLAGQVGDGGVSGNGHLAMDELEVQSALEVARQLHALRAQYAISTGIYAVAESHRVGSEARTIAEDAEANCRVLASALGGPLATAFC